MAAFAAVALSVFATLHAIIAWRLVGAPSWAAPVELAGFAAIAMLFASVPGALASRVLGERVPRWVVGLGFRWMGLMFYWFVLSLVAEPLVRAGAWWAPGAPWAEAAAGAVVLLGLGLSGVAISGARVPPIKRVDVPIAGLDPRLDGLRIAQLSDLHIGHTIRGEFVRAVVARTNAEAPDLVALTGDFVDGSVPDLAADAAPLGDLRARHGVFFVTGNHEYFTGAAEAWCTELRRLGIDVLRNEARTVRHDGAELDVVGLDDPLANEPGHGPDPERAFAGLRPGRASVLLAHQPIFGEVAAAAGISLVLSGHTHGGQLWPFSAVVRLVQPIVAGLERVGSAWVYVSRGTGWWGPPMRLGAPNEITVLTLRRG